MSSDLVKDPRKELSELCQALGAHLDELAASGAWGVPAAVLEAGVAAPAAKLPGSGDAQRVSRAPAVAPLASPASVPLTAAPLTATPLAPAQPATPRASELPEAARARLALLAEEVKSCTRCDLHAQRKQTVFARGSGSSGLMFIGEGPGEEEDNQGLPFVGPAGQLLDRMIGAMKLDRDAVYVCNIVKCRPPRNRKPELDEMQRCMPYLDEQVTLMEPKVIVALGATAVQGLLGTSEGITRLRGQWKLFRGRIPVMPTFHPAFLLRQPGSKREVWQDLQEVMRMLTEGGALGG
ncbi:MAG: uracil-DNA glycosylase family protein [Polyangiaceae bacterium]